MPAAVVGLVRRIMSVNDQAAPESKGYLYQTKVDSQLIHINHIESDTSRWFIRGCFRTAQCCEDVYSHFWIWKSRYLE